MFGTSSTSRTSINSPTMFVPSFTLQCVSQLQKCHQRPCAHQEREPDRIWVRLPAGHYAVGCRASPLWESGISGCCGMTRSRPGTTSGRIQLSSRPRPTRSGQSLAVFLSQHEDRVIGTQLTPLRPPSSVTRYPKVTTRLTTLRVGPMRSNAALISTGSFVLRALERSSPTRGHRMASITGNRIIPSTKDAPNRVHNPARGPEGLVGATPYGSHWNATAFPIPPGTPTP